MVEESTPMEVASCTNQNFCISIHAPHVICYPYTCQSRDFYHIVNSILCQVSTRPIATPRQRQFCALEGCWLLKLNVKCMNELRPFQGSLFLQCKTIKSKQYKLAISLNELKVWLQISVIFRTVKQILLSHVTLFWSAPKLRISNTFFVNQFSYTSSTTSLLLFHKTQYFCAKYNMGEQVSWVLDNMWRILPLF